MSRSLGIISGAFALRSRAFARRNHKKKGRQTIISQRLPPSDNSVLTPHWPSNNLEASLERLTSFFFLTKVPISIFFYLGGTAAGGICLVAGILPLPAPGGGKV
jgi:hypothetical protein